MTEHNPVSVYLMFLPEITSPARRLLQCSSVVRTPAREAIDPLKIKIKIKNKDQTQFALGVKAPNLIKVMEWFLRGDSSHSLKKWPPRPFGGQKVNHQKVCAISSSHLSLSKTNISRFTISHHFLLYIFIALRDASVCLKSQPVTGVISWHMTCLKSHWKWQTEDWQILPVIWVVWL